MLEGLEDVIEAAFASRLAAVHVALPGKVLSYDASKQTADVEVGVKNFVPTATEGEFVTETYSPLYSVPVCWPRGNGQHFAPGLAAGDGVLIVVCNIDPATWYRTGNVSEPGDLRRHDLAHAVCIPGFAPQGSALPPTAKDLKCADAEIGGTSDAAALASKVNQLIQILKTWTVAPNDGGLALQTAVLSAFGLPGTHDVGSAVLKLGS